MENACETTRGKRGIFEPVQQSMGHHVWKWVDSILNTYYSDTFCVTEHVLARLLSLNVLRFGRAIVPRCDHFRRVHVDFFYCFSVWNNIPKLCETFCIHPVYSQYWTIILPLVLYGYETWSLILREEHKLRVFENSVLRRIFGPKRDEVIGGWRKLHN
jgi:hypothetical protein